MNILSINKSDRIGGAAEMAWSLNQELLKQGHQVNMFVCDKTTTADNVFTIPRPRWLFYLSHLLGTDINLFQSDSILKTEQFKQADIIHCHNLHGHYFNLQTLLKMAKLKPVIWTLHDMWAVTQYCSHSFASVSSHGFYPCPKMSSKSPCKRLTRSWLRQQKTRIYEDLPVNLVVPSEWLQHKVACSILMNKELHLIHNGIDLPNRSNILKQAELRKKLNLPQDKKIVLFVASGGKNNLWKGWSYAEQVATSFSDKPELLFLCIGGQTEPTKHSNIRFVDYIADKVLLAEYFAAADAFLLSSTAESFALVVLEAMAAGLPVVAFPVGVVPEVIEHKVNGYIARPADAVDLAQGLEYVLSFDQETREALVETNNKLLTTEYSLAKMAERYLELFAKLS